jgi:hypothetical protein
MPLAKPFIRADIEQRQIAGLITRAKSKQRTHAGVEPVEANDQRSEQLERLVTHKAPRELTQADRDEMMGAIELWQRRMLAHGQELPARHVATLQSIIDAAERARRTLRSADLDHLQTRIGELPPGLRIRWRRVKNGRAKNLCIEDLPRLRDDIARWLDQLITRAIEQAAYWQQHVQQHRPAGTEAIGRDLRLQLIQIITQRLAVLAGDRQDRTKQRLDYAVRSAVMILKALGVNYPNPKKDRKRFVGGLPTKKPFRRLSRPRQSREQRERAKRLRDAHF